MVIQKRLIACASTEKIPHILQWMAQLLRHNLTMEPEVTGRFRGVETPSVTAGIHRMRCPLGHYLVAECLRLPYKALHLLWLGRP